MDTDELVTAADDRTLHVWAAGDSINYQKRGRAIAEIERRRRAYEDERDEKRRKLDILLFNSEGERDVQRKKFEETLADKQMAHATGLAQQQETSARAVAKATRLAAWSAAFSAIAAIVSTGLSILQYLRHP